jgi:molecular chaperone HscB
MIDYFKLLDIEQKYDIDLACLNKQYFAQLAKYHPDRAKDAAQKREYQDISTDLNKAYSILKDNLKRAEHILNLKNIATDEVSLKAKISKEKLAEIWQNYEEFEEIDSRSQLEFLLEQKTSKQLKIISELGDSFKNNNLESALDIIISFKYLVTLMDNIKLKIKDANN